MNTHRMSRCLVSLLLLTSAVVIGQEERPFNVIKISTSDEPTIAFRKMGRLLVGEGYELQTTEPTLMMITTKVTEKKYGFLSMGRIALRFAVTIDEADTGSVVTIAGKFLADAEMFQRWMKQFTGVEASLKFDAEAQEIEERGMSGSPVRASWNAMKEIAEKYENGKVTFDAK